MKKHISADDQTAWPITQFITPVKLGLPASVNSELRWLASKAIPYETGGLIFSDGLVVECPNISGLDRKHHYEMDLEPSSSIHAFWHTHPNGHDAISKEDAAMMSEMFDQGMKYPWIIVGPLSITAWQAR